MTIINERLKKDITAFLDIYNKFEYDERPKMKASLVKGEIDICDVKGNYWDSFDIEIYINKNEYPFCIPLVIEKSKKIERNLNWHINDEGVCCLDIEHQLEFLAIRGINIMSFFQEKIYPFFREYFV